MWQQPGTYQPEGNFYPPFFAAICVHFVLVALIVILPSKPIEREPEQIVTVNLTAMPTAAPIRPSTPSGPPPKPAPTAKPKPQPRVEPPIQPPVEPPPEPAKIEATPVKEKPPEPPKIEPKPEPEVVREAPPPPVSLKPRQVVKKLPPPEPPKEIVKKKDEKAVKRELSELRKKLLQEGKIRERHEAVAEERAAATEAEQLMRRLEDLKSQARIMEARQEGLGDSSTPNNRTSDNPAPSGANNALKEQYYARITGHLKFYWKLPDFKDWPPNILATVAVTIDKSGKILDVQFRKRSGDDAFDRLVRRALDDANPLPPIPPALKIERQEFTADYTPLSITGQ